MLHSCGNQSVDFRRSKQKPAFQQPIKHLSIRSQEKKKTSGKCEISSKLTIKTPERHH